jgi:hypothetical protein
MRAILVCSLSVTLIGCKDNPQKKADVDFENKKTKAALNRTSFSDSKISHVWKKWGRTELRKSNLNRASLDQLLQEIGDKRYSEDLSGEFELLIGELASRDPQAAMAYFNPKKMRAYEPGFVFVASLLAETDPEILKDWLKNELNNGPLMVRAECLRLALLGLASEDPVSALDFYAKGNWDAAGKSDAIQSIFMTWAKKSIVESEAAAKNAFIGEDLDKALYSILLVAKTSDPKLAIRLASQIGATSSREDAICSVLSSWIDSDPMRAIEQLKTFSSSELQGVLMSGLSADSDKGLLNKLVSNNPDQLVDLLHTLVASTGNAELFRNAVFALSPSNPEKVVELLKTLPQGDLKMDLVATQFSVLARDSPTGAVAQVSQLSDEASKIQAYRAIGSSVTAFNYEVTLAAAGELSDSQRKAFMATAIPSISFTDPIKAVAMLARNEIPTDDKRRGEILTKVAVNLANSDLAGADQWMKSLPESQQPFVMKGIAKELAKKDVKALSERLARMRMDASWAAGVKVLIANIKSSDPAMAKTWQDALSAQKMN